MTKEEAKKILEAYIACESKKAHFECSECNCDDGCSLLYEMGTVGEYNEAINMAIQTLEQEPCEDFISRQAVLDLIEREQFKGDAISEIEKLPPVTPKPKTGHWIDREIYDADRWKCSECGRTEPYKENYCPKCGADMRGEQHD